MRAKREEKREDLRGRLIEAATARIIAGGLKGLRARDVTSDAGCALGALYNVFADLDDLIMHVNSMTLRRLEAEIGAVLKGVEDPGETLKILARSYLAFAREHEALWRALFDHHLPPDTAQPHWQLAEHEALIEHIVEPLTELQPHLDGRQLRIRSRSLFAAVHGIVSISLERRFVGIGEADLAVEVEQFVEIMVAGLKARQ
jgi:AcrR family transcriptional regulator